MSLSPLRPRRYSAIASRMGAFSSKLLEGFLGVSLRAAFFLSSAAIRASAFSLTVTPLTAKSRGLPARTLSRNSRVVIVFFAIIKSSFLVLTTFPCLSVFIIAQRLEFVKSFFELFFIFLFALFVSSPLLHIYNTIRTKESQEKFFYSLDVIRLNSW